MISVDIPEAVEYDTAVNRRHLGKGFNLRDEVMLVSRAQVRSGVVGHGNELEFCSKSSGQLLLGLRTLMSYQILRFRKITWVVTQTVVITGK